MQSFSWARAARVAEIAAPAPSPFTCTMRGREWSASRLTASEPSPLRSKGAPYPTRSSMRAGAHLATRSTMAGSHRPAPATIVSWAWDCQLSPGATEAAMPPCAQALEPDRPGRVPASTMLGMGASFRAVNSPAMPAPKISAPSVSTILSTRGFIFDLSLRYLRSCSGLHGQHAVDRGFRAERDIGGHDHFGGHGLERMQDAVQGNALHVRAQVAGPHELHLGMLHRDIVAHRAFGDHHHPARLAVADI